MKRCPTCNRSYTDDAQKFCLDDGSTLLEEGASSFDPQATLAMPGAAPTTPPANPYGSGAGQGSFGSGAGQGSFGSGAGQSGYGTGQGSSGSGSGQSGQGQQAGSWQPSPGRYTPVSTAVPKKSALPWILGGAAVVVIGIVGVIIIVGVALSGSSNKNTNNSYLSSNSNSNSGKSNSNSGDSNSNSSASNNVVIRSTDGKIQVSVPPSWKSTTELNDKADLQVTDSANGMYMIILTDNKADYSDMDLSKHSVGTLDKLTSGMTYSNKTGPTSLTINGNSGVQYEVRGEIKNLNVVYLHTTIETPLHYQQIVAWTLQSKYTEQESMLKDIIQSFREN